MELAETFFNSATRRILTTVGIDAAVEFVWFGATTIPTGATSVVRRYVQVGSLEAMIKAILLDYRFGVPIHDLDGDARRVACKMEGYLTCLWDAPDFDAVEMLQSVFYRNKGAYLSARSASATCAADHSAAAQPG